VESGTYSIGDKENKFNIRRTSIMRKLKRMVAKTNMRKAGIHKPFKKDIHTKYGVTSYFAEHWREYV